MNQFRSHRTPTARPRIASTSTPPNPTLGGEPAIAPLRAPFKTVRLVWHPVVTGDVVDICRAAVTEMDPFRTPLGVQQYRQLVLLHPETTDDLLAAIVSCGHGGLDWVAFFHPAAGSATRAALLDAVISMRDLGPGLRSWTVENVFPLLLADELVQVAARAADPLFRSLTIAQLRYEMSDEVIQAKLNETKPVEPARDS
jgi:hypothetical protein